MWTSFRVFVTKSFFPFKSVVGSFGGTFSSKCIGSVLDFFMGSIGRLGGALGGFLGVASNMGESGPLEFGDNAPFGENTPFPFAE